METSAGAEEAGLGRSWEVRGRGIQSACKGDAGSSQQILICTHRLQGEGSKH